MYFNIRNLVFLVMDFLHSHSSDACSYITDHENLIALKYYFIKTNKPVQNLREKN